MNHWLKKDVQQFSGKKVERLQQLLFTKIQRNCFYHHNLNPPQWFLLGSPRTCSILVACSQKVNRIGLGSLLQYKVMVFTPPPPPTLVVNTGVDTVQGNLKSKQVYKMQQSFDCHSKQTLGRFSPTLPNMSEVDGFNILAANVFGSQCQVFTKRMLIFYTFSKQQKS